MPDESIYTALKNASDKDLVDLNDYDTVRHYISDKITNAVKDSFHAENDRYILQADNISTKWKDYTPKDEKKAIIEGADIHNRVTGKVSLIDKTSGEVVDQTGNITLTTIPYMTERGEYVRGGVRYTFPQQFRASPGVYVRKTDSGDIEAAFNVKQGTGSNFRIDFDPDKTTYYYKVGQRRIPAIYLMKQMGIPEETLKNTLGKEIYEQNDIIKPSPQAIGWVNKLKEDNPDSDNPVRDYFSSMELNERTTHRTLGSPYKNLTPEAFMAAITKINNVYWDKESTDDRDSLAYQHVYDLGDMVADRIRSDKGGVLRNYLWKATNKGSLKNMPSGILNKHLDALFTGSGLAQAVEEISPLDAYVQNQRIVKLGPGAIPSVQQAPLEARAVQPSYLNFIDPVKAPESMRVGLDMYLAENVRKGKKDGLLYTQFYNPKTGKAEWVSSARAADSVLAFPEYMHSDKRFIPAVVKGQDTQYVDRNTVDFVVPTADELSTTAVNMIPLKSGIKGMRILMGSKYSSQALPLEKPEAPLVETILRQPDDSEISVTEKISKYMGAKYSPVAGKVKAVYKDNITVEDKKGNTHKVNLYRNLPLARKTVLHNDPVVKAGDTIEKGGLVAKSNFTADDGRGAPGKNLSVAYMNYMGSSFEDAIVISQGAADKLVHTAINQMKLGKDKDTELNRKRFQTLFPSHFTKDQLNKLDENGIIKPGQKVKFGDPLIVGVKNKSPELSKLGRSVTLPEELVWEKDTPGEVTDIAITDKGYKVYVKTKEKMKVADKLAILQGGKGVVAKIVPDDVMIKDEKGNPIDVIINRITIPSRTNTAQMHSAALGKIAKKVGKPYKLPGFLMGESLNSFVKKELSANNVKTNETVIDPKSGKEIPNIFVGNTYFVKTQQTADSKGKGRGTDFYTAEDEPGRGGKTGAKHMGTMEYEALLGHQAKELIKDTKLIRGQKNDDFWRAVKSGKQPTMPQVPLVYEKMKDTIRAAGINYDTSSKADSIFAMTNKDVEKLTGDRKLESAATFSKDTLKPIPGGLFDQTKTDSLITGTRWSYFDTPEPMLSPIMHDPIRNILDMTKKELNEVISGNKEYNGKRGGQALLSMLKDFNVDKAMEEQKSIIRTGTKSKLDKAVKRYRILNAMKKNNTNPEDFMLNRIPVLPPKYRPITRMDKMTLVNDMNYMYRELYNSMSDFKDAVDNDLPDEDINEARENMNNAFQAAVGLAEPGNKKLQEKQVGGILQQLFGKKSAKASLVQRKVIGSNLDLSGLSTISPNPALKLNEVGLPIKHAWGVYEPFIIQHMVQNNIPAAEAAKHVQAQDKQALRSLQAVIKQRPVIVNRAPSLHKYSLVALWPKLVPGDMMQIPPQLVAPIGGDFDGDSLLTSIDVIINHEELNNTLKKPKISTCIEDVAGVCYPIVKENTNTIGDNTMYSANTKVATTNANIRISDIPKVLMDAVDKADGRITEWDVPNGIYTHSMDRETGEYKVLPITKVSKHRDVLMYNVTLDNSYSKVITCSEDGSLIVYDEGELRIVTPTEAEGKMVPSLTSMHKPATDVIKYINLGNQVPAGYDLGVLIGAIIGDGWVDNTNTMYIASNYDELCSKLLDIYNNKLNIPKYREAYTNTTHTADRWGSATSSKINFHIHKKAAQAFKQLIGGGAENKVIPWQSLGASRTHLIGILVGLLSTDGSISYAKPAAGKKTTSKNVSYDTISPYLRDSLNDLCRKLGIRTSVTTYSGTTSGNVCYKVLLSLEDISKLYNKEKKFRLFNNEKQAKLEKIISEVDPESKAYVKYNRVPYPNHLMAELGWLGLSKIIGPSQHCDAKKKGDLARSYALKFIEEVKDADWSEFKVPGFIKKEDIHERTPEEAKEAFNKWADFVKDDNITWKKVVKVEECGRKDCWDITVPETFTFATSDGIIVQDTMSYTVPVTKAATAESIEKLMPERNLISESTGKPLWVPADEYAEGLYYLSKEPREEKAVYFDSREDMLKAYKEGKIKVDTPVIIK